MKIKHILATVAALVISTSVYATPQYNGDTFGANSDFNTQRNSAGDQSGYYLWNYANNPSKWALRWTGVGVADLVNYTLQGSNKVDWFGSITYASNTFDNNTIQEKHFSTHDSSSFYPAAGPVPNDTLMWEAVTNPNNGDWDGINFVLGNDETLLSFSLGSDLYSDSNLPLHSTGTAGTGIYIGGDNGTWGSTNVLVKSFGAAQNNQRVQSFEISLVPEPSVIALFGLGLVGLGFARRRSLNT